MTRTLLVAATTIAALIAFGAGAAVAQNRPANNDGEALKQFVKEWADAVVHSDLQKLDRFALDNFKGNAQGISFNKRMLLGAIRSGQMKVASWDCKSEDIDVKISGNAARVKGRCILTNATYMGKDFSGSWDFVDHLVKQRDGSWRAVASQSKQVKK